MPKVRFVNELVSAEVPPHATLREVAMQQGVELYRGMWTHVNCRGNGVCGRCRVWVLERDRSRPGASKRSLREHAHVRVTGTMRLACQVRVLADLDVRTRPIGPPVLQATAPELGPAYKAEAERRLAEALEAEHQPVEPRQEAAGAKETKGMEPGPSGTTRPRTA